MLADSPCTNRTAGDREAGARCPHCAAAVALGEAIVACLRCGAVHHVVCWHSHDGCGSFDCAPARRILSENRQPELRITVDEVARVQPSPRPVVVPASYFPGNSIGHDPLQARRWSRLAIAAVIVAVAAIPLFGVVTGLIAILLGSLALGGIHHTRQRGTGLAVTGILLGLAAAVGWIVFLACSFGSGGHVAISLDEFEPDADALNHMAPTIAQSVRANALVETNIGGGLLGGTGVGSGVILQIENGSALIVTNRHVVDPNFQGQESGNPQRGLPDGHLQVKLIGQPVHPGRVEWIAPDGIDLALIRVDADGTGARAASWKPKTELVIGSEVFTIGNPQHLDWTHTRGSISQLRLQKRGARQVHVIQTDAPLNPGNSGGGLYDKAGTLIGINTWTNDKRFSEGLGFAIALDSLLELDPPGVRVHHDASSKTAHE
jgi:S1-C subfamily serine protease